MLPLCSASSAPVGSFARTTYSSSKTFPPSMEPLPQFGLELCCVLAASSNASKCLLAESGGFQRVYISRDRGLLATAIAPRARQTQPLSSRLFEYCSSRSGELGMYEHAFNCPWGPSVKTFCQGTWQPGPGRPCMPWHELHSSHPWMLRCEACAVRRVPWPMLGIPLRTLRTPRKSQSRLGDLPWSPRKFRKSRARRMCRTGAARAESCERPSPDFSRAVLAPGAGARDRHSEPRPAGRGLLGETFRKAASKAWPMGDEVLQAAKLKPCPELVQK